MSGSAQALSWDLSGMPIEGKQDGNTYDALHLRGSDRVSILNMHVTASLRVAQYRPFSCAVHVQSQAQLEGINPLCHLVRHALAP